MITVTKADLPPIEKYIEYLKKIWASHWLTNDGEFVQLLGKKLEAYLGINNLVLLSNGTVALQLALKAFDIKGEVITTPFTFAATTNVLLLEGITPVFADIDPKTYNIDPCKVEDKITDKTSAILPVHVYGNPCNVKQIQSIADRHNLKVIYDAAHAFGVEYEDEPIVCFGDASTFSFHATKVFNTIEGGAVVADDDRIVEKLKLMRNHGIISETDVVIPGTNAKMNEFQAAMGLCNLDSVNESICLRKNLYERYVAGLSNLPVSFQKIVASKYNFSYMPILFETAEERDSVYSLLIEKNIKSRKYFSPLTVNFEYFRAMDLNLVEKYGLVTASDISDRILCLPIYPNLEFSKVDYITSQIEKNHKLNF